VSSTSTYLLQTLLALGAMLLVAMVVLWGARRLGLGAATGPLHLLARLPLEPRRTLYVVRVGPTALVIGASEGGLVKLSELPADQLDGAAPDPAPTRFSDVFSRVLGRSSTPRHTATPVSSTHSTTGDPRP